MRKMVAKILAFALVLACTGLTLGQQQPGKTQKETRIEKGEAPQTKAKGAVDANKPKAETEASKLEEMLAEALKNNPDLRVAVAKVAEAEAELNRTRLQVTQKIVALYYAIETQKKMVVHAATKVENWTRGSTLVPGSISEADIEDKRQALTLAKAKLAELEAQMPALLGKVVRAPGRDQAVVSAPQLAEMLERMTLSSDYESDLVRARRLWLDLAGTMPPPRVLANVNRPLADRIRKALETPVRAEYDSVMWEDVLKDLEKKAPGLSFHDMGVRAKNDTIGLHLKEALPLFAVLQALGDATGNAFYVREYGILITSPKSAPPGAVTVEQFMRHKPPQAPAASDSKPRNPPPKEVEGEVKEVTKEGLMVVSVGSDAGLARGHTLELFRLAAVPAQSKYLGRVRVLEASKREAILQALGRLTDTPRVGDRVASSILGE